MNESSNKLFMAKPPDQKNTSERKIYCPWPYRCNNDLKITHTYFMCLILNTYLQCVHIKLYIFSATELSLSANATKINDFGYNWSIQTKQPLFLIVHMKKASLFDMNYIYVTHFWHWFIIWLGTLELALSQEFIHILSFDLSIHKIIHHAHTRA